MTRQIRIAVACLLAGACAAQAAQLFNTRLHPSKTLVDGEFYTLDLREFFQTYAEPGPVATFTLHLPEQEGFKDLFVEYTTGAGGAIVPKQSGQQRNLMTYKLANGSTYTNLYDVYPEELKWLSPDPVVQFQLLATEAPIAVANFMTYATDGQYTDTIVHRSEISVLQAGGLRLYPTDEYLLEWIDTMDPILFEQTRNNTKGTLAMARTASLNSATSQFFINLADNSGGFGSAYTVFGELLNPDSAFGHLEDMGQATTFNLTSIFRNAPVGVIPLYTPFWDDRASYVRFKSVSIPAGDSSGVAYAAEWMDTDGVEGVSETEAANRAAFGVTITGNTLNISRLDTGSSLLKVSGTKDGKTVSFQTSLIAYNPDALDLFPGAVIKQGGKLESGWFGTLVADKAPYTFPYIWHQNHGTQYASGSATAIYLYDYRLGCWLYTTPNIYPYLYAWGDVNSWLWYVKDTGNTVDSPRWFYKYSNQTWFTSI